jgi:methyl-accepting chemotaxis protein/PAS domain-containing protein
MKKVNIRISQKIMGGFLAIIFIFILNAVIGLFSLKTSSDILQETSQIIDPSKEALNDFNLLTINSRMYITNWVYLRANEEDKTALKKIHQTEYIALKSEINALKPSWDKKQQQKIDSVFTNFESLLKVEAEIMTDLASFEDYEDEAKKFSNQMRIDDEVLPKSKQINVQLNDIISSQKNEITRSDAALLSSFDNLRIAILGSGLLCIVVGLLAAFMLTRNITAPINYIRDIIQQLGKGELPQDQKKKFGNDEIGEMAEAVNKLVTGLRSTSLFAENIGNGHYQADFAPLSANDVLGNALINMRNNLEKVAEDDKRRNWATEGIAKFSEILRSNNDTLSKLSDEIISNLVKYVKANQGGLFIINDTEEEHYLELKACYAWDKKKYLEQKIYEGEGLTGQAWQEKESIYLTEIPQNYISITSGLGESNPRSIIIVPLKVNDQVFGVIEIASFNEFASFEIEFIEKIAESIASTISTVKINEQTQRLLQDSTMLTEQMRAQEEEMRQNMEELQATQEEMERAQKDAKAREIIFDKTQFIVEFDNHFKITYANQPLQSFLHVEGKEILGKPIQVLLDTNYIDKAKQLLEIGNIWSEIVQLKNKNGEKIQAKASAGIISDDQTDGKYLMIFDGPEILGY